MGRPARPMSSSTSSAATSLSARMAQGSDDKEASACAIVPRGEEGGGAGVEGCSGASGASGCTSQSCCLSRSACRSDFNALTASFGVPTRRARSAMAPNGKTRSAADESARRWRAVASRRAATAEAKKLAPSSLPPSPVESPGGSPGEPF